MSWLEHLPKFNKWGGGGGGGGGGGVWNKNVLCEKFLKINKRGDIY